MHVKAGDRFMEALDDVIDPERKRKTIGELFIRVFEEVSGRSRRRRLPRAGHAVSRRDRVGHSTTAAKIKSHHNVGGLPDDMEFELVEPLRHLFKDEVRAVGEQLGLPADIVWRQPFPGPGLAVRIVGTITPERVEILRNADAHRRRRDQEGRPGPRAVAGLRRAARGEVRRRDGRRAHLRLPDRASAPSQSDDAMTADWARLPYDLLETLSSRIINEVPGVNRVVYDITSKPPGTIEWE